VIRENGKSRETIIRFCRPWRANTLITEMGVLGFVAMFDAAIPQLYYSTSLVLMM